MTESDGWAGPDSDLAEHIRTQTRRRLEAYRGVPRDVEEHANIERSTAHGGYGRRQLYELVQNGADAMVAGPGGHIEVLLTGDILYVANHGEPIDADGIDAILASHVSRKRGAEIGRFGLGFKSVLEVTTRPQFFSRSVSFGFDAKWAAETIREIVPAAPAYPALRIAQPLDPDQARLEDPVLDELMTWATTVIRLPRNLEAARWLNEDLANFPAEFLVFAPHVARLILHDADAGTRRDIRSTIEDGVVTIRDGDDHERWRTFRKVHTPTSRARADGGEVADRAEIPIIWAVPLQGRRSRGQFWAFFPTEYETTLSGILNAPWKTNEDRQNLLRGEFNNELLDVAAALIAESAPILSSAGDPASHLDLIPGRGREAPNWADERITTQTYAEARGMEFMPDQDGRLRPPPVLTLPPSGLPESTIELWESVSDRPREWVHRSAVTRQRYSRAERLADDRSTSIRDWLSALVSSRSVEASSAALQILHVLDENASKPVVAEAINTPLVLTSDGDLVKCRSDAVFLSTGDPAQDPSGLSYVDPRLLHHPGVAAALSHFGIKPADAEGALEAQVSALSPPFREADWSALWAVARAVDRKMAVSILLGGGGMAQARARLHARALDGAWRRLDCLYWPGEMLLDIDQAGRSLVDREAHREDEALLRDLGVSEVPEPGGGSAEEPWFYEYVSDSRGEYYAQLTGGSRPQEDYLVHIRRPFSGPLAPLITMPDESRARVCQYLVASQIELDDWIMRHKTQDLYPKLRVSNPVVWFLRRYGVFATARGYRRTEDLMGGPEFAEWQEFLPALDCSQEFAAAIGIPTSWAELTPKQLKEALEAARKHEDLDSVAAFYSDISAHISAPDTIACVRRDRRAFAPPHLVTAALAGREANALAKAGEAVLPVESASDLERLADRWHLRRSSELVEQELIAVERQAAIALSEAVPAFAALLTPDQAASKLVRCAELRIDVITDHGRQSDNVDFHASEGAIHWLDTGDDQDLLRRLSQYFGLGLDSTEIESLTLQHRDDLVRQRQRALRDYDTDARRLAAAVGRDALLRRLPQLLVRQVTHRKGGIDDETAGEMALSVFGAEVLREYAEDLAAQGLRPPDRWAGLTPARSFVRRLGFSEEFAGFETGRRDPTLLVHGRPELPELHGFQDGVRLRLGNLLSDEATSRALLALPTGSGKTRVAVQTVIEHVRNCGLKGPVVWIAQSDELCEQAVQTWSYVWRALGPDVPMTISRLWASNEATRSVDPHVVVATIQKLSSIVQRDGDDYEWVREASVVIIDEAHFATTPSYTAVLEWLGLGRSQGKDAATLIGLTATPFRGTSETETFRLVNRFGGRRLDDGVFGESDPYEALQDMGVLARVSHEILDGAAIDVNDEDLAWMEKMKRLPRAVEQRLGQDLERNARILQLIRDLPSDWPVLLFATSVEHAYTMAALLTLDDVPAQAIAGETPPGARQWAIDRFQSGELRVLTNYGVLTQGFDAPAIRAVIVSRPTFSPTLYQQMIGRGLRGPKNGGKDECLVVNVADTVARFGDKLAFYEFEHLWTKH